MIAKAFELTLLVADLGHIKGRVGVSLTKIAIEYAMYDQVGVAADGRSEMRIVGF